MPLDGRNLSQLSLMPGVMTAAPDTFTEPKNFRGAHMSIRTTLGHLACETSVDFEHLGHNEIILGA